MPLVLTGTKSVTKDASPQITAASLTAIMSTAVENLTISQYRLIGNALSRVPGGAADNSTIGSILL